MNSLLFGAEQTHQDGREVIVLDDSDAEEEEEEEEEKERDHHETAFVKRESEPSPAPVAVPAIAVPAALPVAPTGHLRPKGIFLLEDSDDDEEMEDTAGGGRRKSPQFKVEADAELAAVKHSDEELPAPPEEAPTSAHPTALVKEESEPSPEGAAAPATVPAALSVASTGRRPIIPLPPCPQLELPQCTICCFEYDTDTDLLSSVSSIDEWHRLPLSCTRCSCVVCYTCVCRILNEVWHAILESKKKLRLPKYVKCSVCQYSMAFYMGQEAWVQAACQATTAPTKTAAAKKKGNNKAEPKTAEPMLPLCRFMIDQIKYMKKVNRELLEWERQVTQPELPVGSSHATDAMSHSAERGGVATADRPTTRVIPRPAVECVDLQAHRGGNNDNERDDDHRDDKSNHNMKGSGGPTSDDGSNAAASRVGDASRASRWSTRSARARSRPMRLVEEQSEQFLEQQRLARQTQPASSPTERSSSYSPTRPASYRGPAISRIQHVQDRASSPSTLADESVVSMETANQHCVKEEEGDGQPPRLSDMERILREVRRTKLRVSNLYTCVSRYHMLMELDKIFRPYSEMVLENGSAVLAYPSQSHAMKALKHCAGRGCPTLCKGVLKVELLPRSVDIEPYEDPGREVASRCEARARYLLHRTASSETKDTFTDLLRHPRSVMGRRVVKKFDDGNWYLGTVTGYVSEKETGGKEAWWQIRFDDDDKEDLSLSELVVCFNKYEEVKMFDRPELTRGKHLSEVDLTTHLRRKLSLPPTTARPQPRKRLKHDLMASPPNAKESPGASLGRAAPPLTCEASGTRIPTKFHSLKSPPPSRSDQTSTNHETIWCSPFLSPRMKDPEPNVNDSSPANPASPSRKQETRRSSPSQSWDASESPTYTASTRSDILPALPPSTLNQPTMVSHGLIAPPPGLKDPPNASIDGSAISLKSPPDAPAAAHQTQGGPNFHDLPHAIPAPEESRRSSSSQSGNASKSPSHHLKDQPTASTRSDILPALPPSTLNQPTMVSHGLEALPPGLKDPPNASLDRSAISLKSPPHAPAADYPTHEEPIFHDLPHAIPAEQSPNHDTARSSPSDTTSISKKSRVCHTQDSRCANARSDMNQTPAESDGLEDVHPESIGLEGPQPSLQDLTTRLKPPPRSSAASIPIWETDSVTPVNHRQGPTPMSRQNTNDRSQPHRSAEDRSRYSYPLWNNRSTSATSGDHRSGQKSQQRFERGGVPQNHHQPPHTLSSLRQPPIRRDAPRPTTSWDRAGTTVAASGVGAAAAAAAVVRAPWQSSRHVSLAGRGGFGGNGHRFSSSHRRTSDVPLDKEKRAHPRHHHHYQQHPHGFSHRRSDDGLPLPPSWRPRSPNPTVDKDNDDDNNDDDEYRRNVHRTVNNNVPGYHKMYRKHGPLEFQAWDDFAAQWNVRSKECCMLVGGEKRGTTTLPKPHRPEY